MGDEPVRHHYVPVCLQAFWDPDYIYNGGSKKSRETSVYTINTNNTPAFGMLNINQTIDIFYERHLYSLTKENQPKDTSIEKEYMGEIDREYASTINRILSLKCRPAENHLNLILNFMAAAMYRNRRHIFFQREVSRLLAKETEPQAIKDFLGDKYEMFSDDSILLAKNFKSEPTMQAKLFFGGMKIFRIFEFQEDVLILGAEPVQRHIYEDNKKHSLWVMPITPRHAIFLFSTKECYRKVKQLPIENIIYGINGQQYFSGSKQVIIPSSWVETGTTHLYTKFSEILKDSHQEYGNIYRWQKIQLVKAAEDLIKEAKDGIKPRTKNQSHKTTTNLIRHYAKESFS